MEEAKVIPISDLLRRRRPISGTSSFFASQPQDTAASASSGDDAKTLNPNSNGSSGTETRVLKSLSEPSVITGALSLPNFSDSLSSGASLCRRCFQFSDSSGSVCCDVLDFDFRMIGRKLRVVSWNFIPNKMCNGLLEIIKWEFAEVFVGSVGSFPLFCDGVDGESSCKTKHSVCGVLESVSPVSFITCTVSSNGNEKNLHGFIAEVLACDCRLCKVEDCIIVGRFTKGHDGHDFSQKKFVYFTGAASCWHPAILRLVGKVVSISGLKKKLIYVGKEDAHLMFVVTKATSLGFQNAHTKDLSCRYGESKVDGNGELGMYMGVVTGVYMKRMIVELDEEVCLLLTDQLLVPHSLRVGAVLFLRNVHIVNPKFRWSKMLILGACYKTKISTISFSPLETGFQLPSWSQSLLGEFIESLVFSARLWVLLMVQCFRKKFSGIYSEREILGSKHKEGLVEIYARSRLPISVFCSGYSLLGEFGKHDSCGASTNVSFANLSLAVPFLNFVNNCDRLWVRSLLQMKNGLNILEDCGQDNQFFKDNERSDLPIRRIVPSKDIGISLLGNLKITPATGRLQYIDATGSIDAVIPDLPSAWNMDAIYEVTEYSLVLEGRPKTNDQLSVLKDDLFSCKRIFQSVQFEKQTSLVVYVHFLWSSVICQDYPIGRCPNGSAHLEPGTFHLFHLAHIFPVQAQFHADLTASAGCSSFAEVTVLRLGLNISIIDGPLVTIPEQELEKNCHSDSIFKRCKTNDTYVCSEKIGLGRTSNGGSQSCSQASNFIGLSHKRNAHDVSSASPVQIPCGVLVKRIHGPSIGFCGVLFTQDNSNGGTSCLTSPKKVLLEFDSENFFKYKLLHIGAYYIMKHSAENCLCDSMNGGSASKIVMNSGKHLWRLSFQFGEMAPCSGLHGRSFGSCSISERPCRSNPQNELFFHSCGTANHGVSSDVSIHVTKDLTSLLDPDLEALKDEAGVNMFMSLADGCSTHQAVSSGNGLASLFHGQGKQSWNSLPQGDLVSLQGTVVSLHSGCCSVDGATCRSFAHGIHQLRFAQREEDLICVHVWTDSQMVVISGCWYKHNYPVGLGPGADITCHRILALSEYGRLMLMPVSFITVNSVKEVLSHAAYSFGSEAKEPVASSSLSDLINCDVLKPRRLRCRVSSVGVQGFNPLHNVANFFYSGERAATFLRLHEEMPQVGFGSFWWRLGRLASDKACSTPSFYLGKILKRHGRVTIKNHGSLCETLCQEFQLSATSESIFSTEDEDVLKFIVLNACSSTFWNIIGHVIDNNAVNELEKCLMEERLTMPAIPNVWATEVFPVDTLAEARSLYRDF